MSRPLVADKSFAGVEDRPTPRRVLIIGATGFLGSALTRRFLQRGDQVVALGRGDGASSRLADILAKLEWFQIEHDGVAAPFRAGPAIDLVIYAAANFGRDGERYHEVQLANTTLPLQLLTAAADAACPLFVHADTALRNVVNAYSLSKRQFAEWGRLAAEERGIRFLDLRLEHMYGPGDDERKFPTFVIGSLLRNEPVLRLTLGDQRRDFIFVDDVVAACERLIDAAEHLPGGYQEFSIGSGRSVRIRDFVELAKALTGSGTALEFGALAYRRHEVMKSEARLADMRQVGWLPRVKLEDGLRRTIEAERLRCGY